MKKLIYKDINNNSISYSSFLCKDGFILYKTIRKKNRHKVSLEYDAVNNVYIVICPYNYSKDQIHRIVQYMYKHDLQEYTDLKQNKPWVLLGKELIVETVIGNEFKYEYYGDKLIIYIRNENEYRKIAYKFLSDFATVIFTPRTQELIKQVNERGYLNRCVWNKRILGRCYYWERYIELNSCLIQYPTYVSDSVIYHEIAHFKVPNHYKAFWDLLHTYDPNNEINNFKIYETQCKYEHQYFVWEPFNKLLNKWQILLSTYSDYLSDIIK